MTASKDDTVISKLKEKLLLIEKMEEKAFGFTEDFLKSVPESSAEEAFPVCKSAASVVKTEYKENRPIIREEKKTVRLQMPDSVLASAKKIQRTMPNTPPTLRKPTIAERLEIKPKILNFDDSSIL
ncbi:hypothetical protein FO519_005396 [Halicephalobus sp. NKZ332]|nr:hypothetical protein FO519_005396 [Halicephalobus sp. NKZ332]